MRWSEKETYQFVKIYFGHEHLWNSKHLAYKSNERRLKSYKEMIDEFRNATGILLSLCDLKIKIKNLKSTYSQELSKIKQRSNSKYTYEPAMKWFPIWHKHYQNANKRNTDSSEIEESNTTDEAGQQLWLNMESDIVNEETDVDPFESHNKHDYVYLVKSEPNSAQVKNEKNPYNGKRKKLKHHSLSTDTSEMNCPESLDSSVATSIYLRKEDEFDIYGKYIAAQLRSMTLQKALALQLEIQSLISEARLADLSSQLN